MRPRRCGYDPPALKIALVILHADPARGGAERYTVDLAWALADAGYDVTLVAATFAPKVERRPSRVHKQALPSNGFTRTQRYRRFLDALDSYLDDEHFDVVHAMLPVRRCDVYHPHAGLAVAAFESRKKKFESVFNPRRRAFAQVERALLARSPAPVVLALSEYVKSSIQKYHPQLDDEHLPTLFNAVDLDYFDATARTPLKPPVNALIVAQDFERKGLATAIRALAELRDQEMKLTVVGDDNPSRYRGLASSLGVLDRVRFVGGVRDTRPYYRDADFFVLPTRHDPCSLVVLEALAMGVPVISTRFNGACEVMADGVHGYVLNDPTDVKALAGAMRSMLDVRQRVKMSATCLALRPRLSYEHHLDSLLRIYGQVVEKRSQEPGARSQ